MALVRRQKTLVRRLSYNIVMFEHVTAMRIPALLRRKDFALTFSIENLLQSE